MIPALAVIVVPSSCTTPGLLVDAVGKILPVVLTKLPKFILLLIGVSVKSPISTV